MELVIPPPPQLGNRTVEVANLGMDLGGRTLFRGFNFTFENGKRVGVCGRNGLGKTTLLKIILGQVAPTAGTVKTGQLTKFNYVDQGRLQLNDEHTVLDEASDGTEFVIWGESKISVRSYLKRFLFADDRILTQVKKISGGERSRLLLARILKSGGNFLILDEPTNDLDLPTLRVLEEALIAFPGVMCVVSHDRYFLNRVCTDILAFEGDGKIHHSVGDYDYYLEKKQTSGRSGGSAERRHPVYKSNQRRSPESPHAARNPQSPANCRSRKRANWKAWRRRFTRSRPKWRASKDCSPTRIFSQTRHASEPAHGRTRRREGKCHEALRALGGTGRHQGRGGTTVICRTFTAKNAQRRRAEKFLQKETEETEIGKHVSREPRFCATSFPWFASVTSVFTSRD